MRHSLAFYSGICGVFLFVTASILGGILMEDYNWTSQFISESYAIDTKNGKLLRTLGFIPSGLLLAVFSFLSSSFFTSSKQTKLGFYGLGIFYGLGTVIVGIFPCDSGCNKAFIDPSISQIIHNLVGFLTYVLVPISFLLLGNGLKKIAEFRALASLAIVIGLISGVLVYTLFADLFPDYVGILQRLIEGLFLFWIISCGISIKNMEIN